jgi:tRNA dimethylallyltransferase
MRNKRLIVVAGPTAVGKTAVAIHLAKQLNTEIINADSRQVYKEMTIGTAVPSLHEQAEVRHHLLCHRSIHESYNASRYEQEVITFLDEWFKTHDDIIMVGGSGMYIDAVCRGIDDLPTIDPDVRRRIQEEFQQWGLDTMKSRLHKIDPDYYDKADLNNPKRILKALEVAEMTGKPYSSFLTGSDKIRIFEPVKIGLDLPRPELHERINQRVDWMIENQLLEEARSLFEYRHLNALNTVGYKELFAYFEGRCSLSEAIEKIKAHTRQYARRQLTWFRKDKTIQWYHPNHPDGVGVPRRGI